MREKKDGLMPRGTMRIVSGILESHADDPRYEKAIAAAEAEVAAGFSGGEGAQKQLKNLLRALRQNVANRKEWPAEVVLRRYDLPISYATYRRIRRRYVWRIACELGLAREQKKNGE